MASSPYFPAMGAETQIKSHRSQSLRSNIGPHVYGSREVQSLPNLLSLQVISQHPAVCKALLGSDWVILKKWSLCPVWDEHSKSMLTWVNNRDELGCIPRKNISKTRELKSRSSQWEEYEWKKNEGGGSREGEGEKNTERKEGRDGGSEGRLHLEEMSQRLEGHGHREIVFSLPSH